MLAADPSLIARPTHQIIRVIIGAPSDAVSTNAMRDAASTPLSTTTAAPGVLCLIEHGFNAAAQVCILYIGVT